MKNLVIPKSFLQTIENKDEENVDDGKLKKKLTKKNKGSILMAPNGSGFAKILSNEGEFEKQYGNSNLKTEIQIEDIPNELKCSICKNLLKKAVIVQCCNTHYCDSCITKTLLEETHFHCPNCKKQIDLDNLSSDLKIRKKVEEYKKSLNEKKKEENKIDISTLNPSSSLSSIAITSKNDKDVIENKKIDEKLISKQQDKKNYSSNKKFDDQHHEYKRKRSKSPKENKKSSPENKSSRDYKYRRYSRSPDSRRGRRRRYDDEEDDYYHRHDRRSSSRERYHRSSRRTDSKERERKISDSRDRSSSRERYHQDSRRRRRDERRSSSRERYHKRSDEISTRGRDRKRRSDDADDEKKYYSKNKEK